MDRQCVNCEWWVRYSYEGAIKGECRCHPPRVVVGADNQAATNFPVSYDHSWCGEFKERVGLTREHLGIRVKEEK